ncbi:DNA repair protein XRCC3 isoform X1 [Cricetulus griseus]|uniref:DNA repair protein XRCC3 isoform X1 n=1 Tax=Cricetulus griseus TaxID=10029 RepID=UPI000454534D|nr:DNA repair protein XRCC3 isoform X1 [Cricetulus griseus]XP_035304974.1 DNA repair protein XRCC3 isoform X1 [Cricetulus griseus]XP_035304975.1 DNA repair protein XRCC3 isoform X1 [Cricetulus griseus]
MDLDQLDLNPRITAAIKKGRLRSVKEVLCYSGPDLQRLTSLSTHDVQHLLRVAALLLQGSRVLTALQLFQQRESFPEQHQRLSLGCPVLDQFLGGGLPLEGITDLAGRSSAGKTQLGLQLCLTVQFPRQYGGLEAGAVYICTEDAFPSKRLWQLIEQQQQLRTDVPGEVIQKIRFSNHIFIEHAADVDALLECVSKRVPILLSRGMARLVVVDSVAAPFRCEYDAQALATRAKHLQSLGAALRRLSSTFRSPVLCINQVGEAGETELTGKQLRWLLPLTLTWVFPGDGNGGGARVYAQATGVSMGTSTYWILEWGWDLQTAVPTLCLRAWDEHLSPALGITWANQILMRLMVDRAHEDDASMGLPRSPARTIRVLSAPHLPLSSCCYTVSAEGIRGIPGTESC